jgi:O-antigen/teichoic acid export membrane protein
MRKRLVRGIGANFLGQLIYAASRILLAPLFLMAWGASLYGEWLVLSSMSAYLFAFTDLGGQLYIVNRLTQAYARKDVPLFCRLLHTGLAMFLVIPSAVFGLFLAAITLFPPASLLKITITSQPVVFWVLALLAFQFVFGLPQGILLGVYRAVGLLPRGVMLGNLMQLLAIIFVASGLWLKVGMIAIAVLQILPFLIIALIALWDLNRRFPQFHLLSLKEAEFSFGLTFIKPSMHFLMIQVSQAFTIQGMVLIVGMILGPVQVVVFSTIRTLVNLIRSFFEQVSHAAWPEMTRLDSQQNPEKFLALFRGILRSTLMATVVFAMVFHFYGSTIYSVWLHKKVAYNQFIMDLLLVYMAQFIFWLTCSHPLLATNQHQTLSKILVVSATLKLVLAYAGGRHFGLPGVVLGMIAGDALIPLWSVPCLLARHQKQFSFPFFIRELIPYVLCLALPAMVPWLSPIIFLGLVWWWTRCLPGYVLETERWERIRRMVPFQ